MSFFSKFILLIIFYSFTAVAEDNWLITPEEYNQHLLQQDVIEEVNFITLTNGPRIDIIKPKALK